MAFTPGPWQLTKTDDHGWCLMGQSRAGIAHAVAECHSGDDNAHLIAAAPELLAACEAFVEWDGGSRSLDVPNDLAETIRAAIAKARGA